MPPDQRDRLLQLARDAGLSPARVSALEGQFRPSVRLFTTRIEGDVPVGTCRMGGAPDLPVGASWPRHGESDLDFLVQLDLAEVAAVTPDTPLPREGLLSFFAVLDAEQENYGTVGRVLYTPAGTPLAPLPAPSAPEQAYGPMYPASIELVAELSIPCPGGQTMDAIGFGEQEPDNPVYWNDVWMNRSTLDETPAHRLLGFPDMEYAYHLEDGDLLLQIDADDAAYFEFGDCQPLRFVMPRGALARHAWDEVIVNGDEE